MAKLELAQTGQRRVFACGRCGQGVSLAWNKCEHCKATFDDFAPIDTGQVIGASMVESAIPLIGCWGRTVTIIALVALAWLAWALA